MPIEKKNKNNTLKLLALTEEIPLVIQIDQRLNQLAGPPSVLKCIVDFVKYFFHRLSLHSLSTANES